MKIVDGCRQMNSNEGSVPVPTESAEFHVGNILVSPSYRDAFTLEQKPPEHSACSGAAHSTSSTDTRLIARNSLVRPPWN